MKYQFMIQIINRLKKVYHYFEVSRKTILVYFFSIGLLWNSSGIEEKIQNKEQELMKTAKKGNILVSLRLGSGPKGGGQVSVLGTLQEIPKPNEVEVLIKIGSTYFVPTKMEIDSGQLYPVWYTDDLELLIARSVETREGNIQYLKEFNEKRKFIIEPMSVLLTTLQLFMFMIDFLRNLVKNRKLKKSGTT